MYFINYSFIDHIPKRVGAYIILPKALLMHVDSDNLCHFNFQISSKFLVMVEKIESQMWIIITIYIALKLKSKLIGQSCPHFEN